MPDPSPAKRTRASVPRPRSGCNTCKRRHVKCDETKPECQKCIQTGRKCDGYSNAPAKPGSRLSALASTLSISSYEIPFKIPGSQNDRRIFHYYCVHASNDLAGLSKSDFWTRLVLQCSQDEPVVRSALLALSYEHLDYVTRDPRPRNRSRRRDSASLEGLQQHHKAVRQLRRYIGTSKKPSVKAVLVCCILFYHFECSRDDSATALLHLRNGLAILRSQKDPDASPPGTEALLADDDMQELVKTLSRLDTQASVMDTSRMPELDLVTEEIRQGVTPCVDPPGGAFTKLQEADTVLARLQNWTMRFAIGNLPFQHADPSQLPAYLITQKSELMQQCTRWSEAVDAFEASSVAAAIASGEDNAETHMYIAELRLGLYSTLMHLHGLIPYNPSVLNAPNPIAHQALEQLSRLIPAFVAIPRPRVASLSGPSGSGTSQAASPSAEDSDVDDEGRSSSVSGTHLQPPSGGARSRSASPSPLPDSVPNTRSFCAQGNTIATLFILAAKTTSKPFRDQLTVLLAQVSQRREGPWSGAIAYDVLRRLQDLADGNPDADPAGLLDTSASDYEGSGASSPVVSDDSADMLMSAVESSVGSSVPVSATPSWDASTLTQRAREYAAHMLDDRPFCAVAACLRRGYHAERCVWCAERPRPVPSELVEDVSLETVGARRVGGVSGFERLLQERGRKGRRGP